MDNALDARRSVCIESEPFIASIHSVTFTRWLSVAHLGVVAAAMSHDVGTLDVGAAAMSHDVGTQ